MISKLLLGILSDCRTGCRPDLAWTSAAFEVASIKPHVDGRPVPTLLRFQDTTSVDV